MTYEDFLENPLSSISKISKFCDLSVSQDCMEYMNNKQLSWTTISPPKQDKWKQKSLNEVNKILPIIAPLMKKLGYII